MATHHDVTGWFHILTSAMLWFWKPHVEFGVGLTESMSTARPPTSATFLRLEGYTFVELSHLKVVAPELGHCQVGTFPVHKEYESRLKDCNYTVCVYIYSGRKS